MAQPSEPRSPGFVVVVTGPGLRATALAVPMSAPIVAVTAHRDPDCVIVVGADAAAVRAAEPDLPAGVMDRTGHAREPQP
jgi:hypothetical protein